ncbi:zinc finger protein 845 [Elysia marginata]|uniref:Zinc finger protein 845 n=1 Tax=Elysia marginata TaxID=1093978 RepID=A0AAV4G7B8_9GAST|nr:zinc finger protein 845 [Elysia marginata]
MSLSQVCNTSYFANTWKQSGPHEVEDPEDKAEDRKDNQDFGLEIEEENAKNTDPRYSASNASFSEAASQCLQTALFSNICNNIILRNAQKLNALEFGDKLIDSQNKSFINLLQRQDENTRQETNSNTHPFGNLNHVDESSVKILHNEKDITLKLLLSNKILSKKICSDKFSVSNNKRTYCSEKRRKARKGQQNNCPTKKTDRIKTSLRLKVLSNNDFASTSSGNDNKQVECKICMESYNSDKNLHEHMNSHALEECYKIQCMQCNVYFEDAELLQKHYQLTDCPGFKCQECSQSFGLESLLLKHQILAHKRGDDMICDECGKKCPTRYALARHKATHAKSQPYTCKICGKHKSSLEHILRYHLPTVHKLGKNNKNRKEGYVSESKTPNTELDDKCGETNEPSSLKKRRVSSKPLKLKGAKFYSFKSLSDGESKEESAPKRKVCIDCNICGGKVPDEQALIIHRQFHFMEGKFTIHCSGCPEKFSQMKDLISHAKHKQCSRFKCDDCKLVFPTELSFVIHKFKSHSPHTFAQASGFYTCTECSKNFESFSAYVDHSAEHVNSMPFECKICNATFISENLLESHLKETHTLIKNDEESSTHKCAQCLEVFKTKVAIRDHRQFHRNREILCENKEDYGKPGSSFASYMTSYFCQICLVGFSGATHLERHKQMHAAVANKPKCNICGQMFSRNCYLNAHMGYHNKAFLCTACGKTFSSSQTLRYHTLAYHSAVNPYQCKICHKFYSSNGALRHHMKVHTGEKRFECKTCGKKFGDSNCLESHILIHSVEKRFKCSVCNYKCRHKSVLERHMDMHNGVKRYHCSYCGKQFRQHSGMKAHLTIHTGEKKYECEYCGKRFARRDYLNVHTLTHTKAKPWSCPVCGDKFAVASNLNSHVRKVHSEEDYKWFKELKAKNKGLIRLTMPTQETGAVDASLSPKAVQDNSAPFPSDQSLVNSMLCPASMYPTSVNNTENRISSGPSVNNEPQQMFYW